MTPIIPENLISTTYFHTIHIVRLNYGGLEGGEVEGGNVGLIVRLDQLKDSIDLVNGISY